MHRHPLVLLVGFLGSGKTTLLRDMIPELASRGLGVSVIINDYQNARVDAATLGSLAKVIEPISGSCVCCGSRDEFLDALETIPMEENGVLLIESNGTTDPIELIEALSLDQRASRFLPPMQISVVDVKRWQKRHWHNDLERLQVRTAARLYPTRLEEVSPQRIETVRGELSALNHMAHFTDLPGLAGVIAELKHHPHEHEGCDCGHKHDPHHDHDHAHDEGHHPHHQLAHAFSSMQVELPETVGRVAFEAWLAGLPESVLRAKGVVELREEPGRTHVFQRVESEPSPVLIPLGSGKRLTPVAVLIGCGIDEAAVRASVARLR